MPFELNFKNLFQDFNPSKFVVHTCLLIFSLLLSLRFDERITWSYWVVFLPLWIWKGLTIAGASTATWVWWRHPQYRQEGDAYTQYKAVIISTGLHMLLLMFELQACDKLENKRPQVLWVLVFIPVIFLSLVSVGICIWSVKHERSFEVVFVPLWILLCVSLIGVLYVIILALILLKSPDLVPEQRRSNVWSAGAYTCLVVPFLVFLILLANKLDHKQQLSHLAVCIPLLVTIVTLLLLSFGAKKWNQWWFGLRKDFCPFLLGVCPLLQEYGNISYKLENSCGVPEPQNNIIGHRGDGQYKKRLNRIPLDDLAHTVVPIQNIEVPD